MVSQRKAFKARRRGWRHYFHADGIHLAVGEHGDSAVMPRLIRIMMDQLMQRGACRHGIQQQDKPRQQRGNHCLAVTFKMTPN